MKRIYLVLITVLALSSRSVACDCDYAGDFMKVAPEKEFVALIQIVKYLTFDDIYGHKIPMSMEVEIVEIYKGKEEKRKVVVWGDNGALCRPYLSEFKLGKYYVIAFHRASNELHHEKVEETSSDYAISNCGEYWMKANPAKKVATSFVRGKQVHIKLNNLKEKLSQS